MIKLFSSKITLFLIVGLLNTLLGFLLFPCIYFFFSSYQKHYVIMLVVSQILCITNAYLTNKFLVFHTRGNYLSEISHFFSFHGLYFLITITLIPLGVESFQLNPVVLQLGMSLFVMMLSYLWYNYFTFTDQIVFRDSNAVYKSDV